MTPTTVSSVYCLLLSPRPPRTVGPESLCLGSVEGLTGHVSRRKRRHRGDQGRTCTSLRFTFSLSSCCTPKKGKFPRVPIHQLYRRPPACLTTHEGHTERSVAVTPGMVAPVCVFPSGAVTESGVATGVRVVYVGEAGARDTSAVGRTCRPRTATPTPPTPPVDPPVPSR